MTDQKSHQAIETYFKNPKHQLANLIDKVNQLRTFNQSLIGILDPNLAKHCEIVNIKDGAITLIADNPSWATKIRFQSPDILGRLKEKQAFKSIKSIKVLIRPKDSLLKKQKPKVKTWGLSADNAEMIKSLAGEVDNLRLKNALQKLAKIT
jgi:hypothetical protein